VELPLTRQEVQAAGDEQLSQWQWFIINEKNYKPTMRTQLIWIMFELDARKPR